MAPILATHASQPRSRRRQAGRVGVRPARVRNQSSPRIVAVASYSPVVTPSVGLTGAPPGQVWPPPLTVTSLAPQGNVVVTTCGAAWLVVPSRQPPRSAQAVMAVVAGGIAGYPGRPSGPPL